MVASFSTVSDISKDVTLSLADQLRRDVHVLAADIGERNALDDHRYRRLRRAADFIEAGLVESGLRPARQRYVAHDKLVDNIELEIPGSAPGGEILVVGAHYDSAPGSPGANDNGTGIAGLLALARAFAREPPARTVRLVAFTNEEHPFTRTHKMGSLVYARRCRARGDAIRGMLSLETIGYYSDAHSDEAYPFPLRVYSPWRADFVAIVGNIMSRRLAAEVLASFRRCSAVRAVGAVLPGFLPLVKSSDHWSFWRCGYPALMVTDTAMLRYRHYHRASDTVEKVNYPRAAQVVNALRCTLFELAGVV